MDNHSAFILQGAVSVSLPDPLASPVRHAWEMLARDMERVLGVRPVLANRSGARIVVRYASPEDRCPSWPEAWAFRYERQEDRARLHIVANDDLGLVYGMLHFSERWLGVDPFWFWADLPPRRKPHILLDGKDFDSVKPRVRFRGWFVNDEVCLIGWTEEYPPPEEVWLPVFEALLRCGGNMVIPGTDLPKHGVHAALAREMGLWVTHHHAEPLGAEMFARAYPGRRASYHEHPELFEKLWLEAIEKQKDDNIVWVLSFRGQGDKPFWEDDPRFDTPEKRGELISRVVRKQYEMVRARVKDPVCSIALYGEIAELYKAGHIEVPEDVIKIWADNGYGRMVSRRQGNENLRVPSLPDGADGGRNGVYYHVTFHDLQASSHLTMTAVHPKLIERELEKIAAAGATEYLLVNSGNIRPHLYPLDMLRVFWRDGTVDAEAVLGDFVRRLFSAAHDEIAALYMDYFRNTIAYGPHEDDKAGEEFYHHPARIIIGHWIQGKGDAPCEALKWAAGDVPFPEQVAWFRDKCASAIPGWERWMEKCDALAGRLSQEDAVRLRDQLRFHAELHWSGCKGMVELCEAYSSFREKAYPIAFVRASRSMWAYQTGLETFRKSEHGKWRNFYRADWLTNIENTIYNVDTLRRFIRMHGDSPDFFLWYKAYLMPESEKHIYLENTHRNPLSDDALAKLLERKFIDLIRD